MGSDARAVIGRLHTLADPAAVRGMARFGIRGRRMLGISVVTLRRLAREFGTDHRLAQQLWASGIHEARILASMVDDPAKVTAAQMERWIRDFDSWDLCDQCCSNLFDKTPFAHRKALAWSRRSPEFQRRAGFALMAALAVHDEAAPDRRFLPFLRAVADAADDERNFVKKAANWALRQMGKRSLGLNRAAIRTARTLLRRPSASARWIAADALRELTGPAVRRRLEA